MQKSNVYLGIIILLALLVGVSVYYLSGSSDKETSQVLQKEQNLQPSQEATKKENKDIDQNVVYDMGGDIKEIKGNVIFFEDKIPQPLTNENADASPRVVEIKMATDGVLAKGDSYITLQDLKVGDSVLVKTNTEGGELTAKKIYVFASQD